MSPEQLEFWKTFFERGSVGLLFFTFVFGAGALIFSGRLNFVKDAELRKFNKDLTEAKISLGTQEERAAVAERALLELQQRVKPRNLTDAQRAAFVKALAVLPNAVVKFGYTSGSADEGFNFARQLLPLFKQANWVVPEAPTGMTNHLEIQVTGVGVLVRPPIRSNGSPEYLPLTPVMAALQNAFKEAGIQVQFINYHPEPGDVPEVIVGSKPEPEKSK